VRVSWLTSVGPWQAPDARAAYRRARLPENAEVPPFRWL